MVLTSKTNAETVFDHINSRRRRWQNEEEVRLAWVSALEAALGLHFDAERSDKDSSYNNVIIEFKAPGLFRGSKESAKFKEATEKRLLPYIKREAKKSGIPTADYIGIAIDGDHICFVQVRDDEIHCQHLVEFSAYAVQLVLAAIKADTRRSITSENLLADFGHASAHARSLMQVMADGLAVEIDIQSNSKIKMLFEEWRALYGQVADMSVLQAEAISEEIGFSWAGRANQAMPGRLFVIHTYNSLLIKLLAAEIVSAHGLTTTQQPAQAMAALLDDTQLLNTLDRDIEHAGIFNQACIHGFVEEAIFSWYLDTARKSPHSTAILSSIRMLVAALSMYRTDFMTHTRDVLRDLYQGLVPGKLRQSLGEFYTPDWLVDFTIDQCENGAWLDKRVLDPTCGSGAFLIAILRRKRAEATRCGWNNARIIDHLCTSVWGFDLNPLAVQTSRVNYLMEIADLLRSAAGHPIEIPVLLADAIYSPADRPEKAQQVVRYQIGSVRAGLDIALPSKLAFDRTRLDQVFAQMGEDVESDYDYETAELHLCRANLISAKEVEKWRAPLKHTYTQILTLHRQQWNGIWFRIVRNFFWSATAGRFDCIVGNPPWVRWSKLPEAYRERVKPMCEAYEIFSATKRHGGNELDISAIIIFTTSDKWLKLNGRVAFVITGSIFKNPSSAGFRKFRLSSRTNSTYLAPICVDDMQRLKPFADAANHTVVAVFDKQNEPGTYPVPYRLWDSADSFTRAIPEHTPLEDVFARVTLTMKEAAPVDEHGSPWAVLSTGRFTALKLLAGACTWLAGRKGITTDLNGVYFVPVLQNNGTFVQICSRPSAGKKALGASKTAWIEPALLYPLIKGAGDFEACYLRLENTDDPPLYTILPNTGIDKEHYELCETELNSSLLRKTKAWLGSYRALLEDRSTYRRQMKGAPFYAVYNVGEYTFKPWKVIWPEMATRFYAAVAGLGLVPIVGKRPYVPDHKVYFLGFDDEQSACYVCGMLNTHMVREWIQSHTVSIQMGNIFKHMNLPVFDCTLNSHVTLAKLVAEAHREHDANLRRLITDQVNAIGEGILTKWGQANMSL